ncbi:MAG: RnfABCDGE type electron transport complex subunit B [Nitrosomonas sp.]|nr:RnfABCDGE type electron transport complex subunit B [Nitrosomonas sp.]
MTDKSILSEQVDAILPQIHCGQCSYDGCQPYATAIVEGKADINQCPPGEDVVIEQLAKLLGLSPKPLDTTYGHPLPRAIAVIDETQCIGCTFCLRACPVDAIVGAAKLMHTVISQECTGCERCLAPCPMDCIHMQPMPEIITTKTLTLAQTTARAQLARQRYQFRKLRLARKQQAKSPSRKADSHQPTSANDIDQKPNADTKQAAIQAAMARARASLAMPAGGKIQG